MGTLPTNSGGAPRCDAITLTVAVRERAEYSQAIVHGCDDSFSVLNQRSWINVVGLATNDDHHSFPMEPSCATRDGQLCRISWR